MINSKKDSFEEFVNNIIEKAEKKVDSMKEEQKKNSIERQQRYTHGEFLLNKIFKRNSKGHSTGKF